MISRVYSFLVGPSTKYKIRFFFKCLWSHGMLDLRLCLPRGRRFIIIFDGGWYVGPILRYFFYNIKLQCFKVSFWRKSIVFAVRTVLQPQYNICNSSTDIRNLCLYPCKWTLEVQIQTIKNIQWHFKMQWKMDLILVTKEITYIFIELKKLPPRSITINLIPDQY